MSALNDTWGGGFYNVPPEAALDRAAADEALGGDQLVIDVQTHYVIDSVAARPTGAELPKIFLGLGEVVAGDLIDRQNARSSARTDDLAWVKAALEEYSAKGTPSVV